LDIAKLFDMTGKVAVVTGGSRGLGREMVLAFAQAGADALELNLYRVPTRVAESGSDIEDRAVETVRTVAAAVGLPLAVKLSPFYSALPHLAARLKDAGRPFSTEAAKAKLFATDAAMRVTTDAVQVLGGAGYVSDHPAERWFREAKVLQIVEGTNQIQRLVISRSL